VKQVNEEAVSMAEQIKHHLINGSWYLISHENLEQILYAIGKSLLCEVNVRS